MGVISCETMTGPINSGDFDPLQPPGSNQSATVSTAPSFKAGQFVRASIDNTAFFKTRPKGDAEAEKLLVRGTSMKVISISGSYVKVELDSGEIGFVPSIMLEDPNAVNDLPPAAAGEYQLYPPLPSTGIGEPLPVIDPAGLPPEGAIPTVIDPDALPETPVPPVTPTTETFPTPPVPPEESVPLPPNEEELQSLEVEKAAE